MHHLDSARRPHERTASVRKRLGHAGAIQPALSLLELLVALTILGLSAGLAFAQIGPWLSLGRASAREAVFWRAVTPADLVLNELTTGIINPDQIESDEQSARFTSFAPRLAPLPFTAELRIRTTDGASQILLSAPEPLALQSVLLESPAPLRLRRTETALLVEAQRDGQWRPLLAGALAANAPFVCAFDPIPRSCR
jgi:prepilin-type N-terminal cleavage/methylation domain-containing protein